GRIGHTPAGVPVAITSPTSKVMIREAASMSCGIRNTIWFVFESCRTAPFTRRRIGSRCGSRSGSAATASDTGAKVSNPFAAVHGEPSSRAFACRSRAVMSKNTEYPATWSIPVRPRAQLDSYKRDRHDREGNPDHEADQPSQIPILSRVQLSEDRNEVEDRMHDHGGQVVRDEGPSATHEPGLRETVSENRGRARVEQRGGERSDQNLH